MATTDAEQRLLPALAGAPGTPLVAAALADLDEALRDGRTAHVRGAAAGLGEALDQNAAAGDGVSQPDRSAIRLVLFVVEAALP